MDNTQTAQATKNTNYLPIDADPEVYAFMWKSEQQAGKNFSFGEKIQLGLGAVENADELMKNKVGTTYAEAVELYSEEIANALMFSAINKMIEEEKLTCFINGRTIKWCVRIKGNSAKSKSMTV